MTHRDDPFVGIIFTDGACLNNGQPDPRAAWGFHHSILPSGEPALAGARLEKRGPFPDSDLEAHQTSNRAELRAIIAALRFRHWPGEGFKTMEIATDSFYAVDGATSWCKKWLQNGWETSQPGSPDVKNRDLWEALLGEAERAKENGPCSSLWLTPRELNTIADGAAKRAAKEGDTACSTWGDVRGINCWSGRNVGWLGWRLCVRVSGQGSCARVHDFGPGWAVEMGDGARKLSKSRGSL